MTEKPQTEEKWCWKCDGPRTFYRYNETAPWCCSECEAPFEAQASESAPIEEPLDQAPDAKPLIDDLDHIRIQLTGAWTNEDIAALGAGMQASADAAKEDGLGLSFFAVKKGAAAQARSSGSIVVPFRDRHGRIMPGRALNLNVLPGEPRSQGAGKIILPGDK